MKFPRDPQTWPDGPITLEDQSRTALRWESEGGLWRVQLDPMLFGWRCHVLRRVRRDSIDATPIPGMEPLEWPSHEVVYCCGPNRMATLIVPRLVVRILESFHEHTPLDRVRAAFPTQTVKPIDQDRRCLLALAAAAGVAKGARGLCRLLATHRDTLPPPTPMGAMLAAAGGGV